MNVGVGLGSPHSLWKTSNPETPNFLLSASRLRSNLRTCGETKIRKALPDPAGLKYLQLWPR
jgi:hypothetical protein